MRQESAVALGKAEAERWVMDRSRSGRSTAGAGKATLDAIQVTADQIAALIERRAERFQRGGVAAGQPAPDPENRPEHRSELSQRESSARRLYAGTASAHRPDGPRSPS